VTSPDTVRQQKINAFAAAVRPSLADVGAVYQHGPAGGHEWRWSNGLGVWALHAGGILDAGPRLTGPGIDNRWRLLENTLQHADLVLLMLQLAGGIPGPDRPVAQIAGSDLWPADDGVPVTGSGLGAERGRTYAFLNGQTLAPGRTRREGLTLYDRHFDPVSVLDIEAGGLTAQIPFDTPFAVTEADGPGTYYLDGYVKGAWVHYTLSLVPGYPMTVVSDLPPDTSGQGFVRSIGSVLEGGTVAPPQ
jgi:hypothetical protein